MNGPRNPLLTSIVLTSLLAGLERELREGKPDGAQQNTPKPLSLEEILRSAPGAPGLRSKALTAAEFIAMFGGQPDGPCECPVCTKERAMRGAEGAAGNTPTAAEGTQTNHRVIEVSDVIAALVGLTPDMLDDTPDAPETVLRLQTASFISTLRGAYADKEASTVAHNQLGEAAEVQALASLHMALAALGE